MARTQTRRAWVIANRLTYIGELGWELHIPTEMAQHVFDVLWEAGGEHGLRPAGYHALEHLRSERAYREYELDLTPVDTLLEAGLGFTIDWSKACGFQGKAATEAQKAAGTPRKPLLSFKLRDPKPPTLSRGANPLRWWHCRLHLLWGPELYPGVIDRTRLRQPRWWSQSRVDRLGKLADRNRRRAVRRRRIPAGFLRSQRPQDEDLAPQAARSERTRPCPAVSPSVLQ